MNREELVLASLAPGNREVYSPVQVQKLLFILDRVAYKVTDGPHFNFEPYDYGPFDMAVYEVLGELSEQGLVKITPGRWNSYNLTASGQEKGMGCLNKLSESYQTYFQSLSDFVMSLSFSELVSSVYKAYPEMKVNSVFRD